MAPVSDPSLPSCDLFLLMCIETREVFFGDVEADIWLSGRQVHSNSNCRLLDSYVLGVFHSVCRDYFLAVTSVLFLFFLNFIFLRGHLQVLPRSSGFQMFASVCSCLCVLRILRLVARQMNSRHIAVPCRKQPKNPPFPNLPFCLSFAFEVVFLKTNIT